MTTKEKAEYVLREYNLVSQQADIFLQVMMQVTGMSLQQTLLEINKLADKEY